jgi:hypothetical protein
MLASVKRDSAAPSNDNGGWAVLLDSETYPLSTSDIDKETLGQPLPRRFRNTVAHELVHSLAFRPTEFGVRLQGENESKESFSELVKAIERETERLSPLLLWPEKALLMLLAQQKQAFSPDDLVRVTLSMGISRQVLISRLRLIPASDEHRFRQSNGLKNIGIGIAEWIDKRTAALRSWPLFLNFERNIIPTFLLNLLRQDRIHAPSVFVDEDFAMCGGWNNTAEFELSAGVSDSPHAHKMRIQVSSESAMRERGEQFFFVVRKISL